MFFDPFKQTCQLLIIAYGTLILVLCALLNPAKLQGEDKASSIVSIDTSFGPIVASRSFDPDQARPLEPFEMTIVIETPSQYQVAPNDLSGDYGDFFCEFLGEEEGSVNSARNTFLRRWKLYPSSQSDVARLPPIPIRLALKTQSINEKPVVVLIPATTTTNPTEKSNVALSDIHYDLSPIKSSSFIKTFFWAFVVLLIVLVIIWRKRALLSRLVLLVASRLRKGKGNGKFFSIHAEETPFARAIRELDLLKTSNVYLENQPGFYSVVDDILRRYLSGEFLITTSEMTSNEIIATINASPLFPVDSVLPLVPSNRNANEESRRVVLSPDEMKMFLIGILKGNVLYNCLSDVLNRLDLAKFANISTTFDYASDLYSSIRLFIEQASSQKEVNLKALDALLAPIDHCNNVVQSQ